MAVRTKPTQQEATHQTKEIADKNRLIQPFAFLVETQKPTVMKGVPC
jgi:hypothetical protein